MIDKDPTSFSLVTYAWVLLLAGVGGFVSFMRRLKEGHVRAFNVVEFVGEIVTSAFAGVITFWLCEHAQTPQLLTAAMVGISGHAGSRALHVLESWLEKRFPS